MLSRNAYSANQSDLVGIWPNMSIDTDIGTARGLRFDHNDFFITPLCENARFRPFRREPLAGADPGPGFLQNRG